MLSLKKKIEHYFWMQRNWLKAIQKMILYFKIYCFKEIVKLID